MSTHRAFENTPSEGWAVPLGQSGYRLYPFAVCRVAAQPFDPLRSLRSPVTIAAQAGLEAHEARLGQAREELQNAFHQAVGAADGKRQRRLFLAAARNLRRRGKLSPAQEERLGECGSRGLLQAMTRWRRSMRRARQAERELEETHDRERVLVGRGVGRFAEDPMFSRALALSSPVLYRTWRQARERYGELAPRNRARRRLEASLLKYYTRSATKTTPFSSFTWIARATLTLAAADRQTELSKQLIALPDGEAISATSLNKTLYSVLHRSLRGDRELFECFAVTLNPSLVESSSGFTMLLAQAGSEKTIQLPAVPAIRLAAEVLRERGGTCPYVEFVDRLAANFAVTPAQLEPRIHRMIEAGILQLNSSIADYELDWVPILEAQLAPSSSPAVLEVRRLLRRLDGERQLFETLDADGRLELLERAGQQVEPLLPGSSSEANARDARAAVPDPAAGMLAEQKTFLRRNLFYEDTFLDQPVEVDTRRLLPALEELTEWADWMSDLSLHWAYHANMRAYFDRRFAAESVPFLDFYRGFLTEVYEPILRFERDLSSGQFVELANPFDLESLPRAIRAANRLRRLIAKRWAARPRAESLQLRREDLEAIATGSERSRGPGSVSLFVQLLKRASVFEKDALLVDKQTIHAGMGRYFSRFLYGLDRSCTRDLRAHNSRFDDALVAELCDDGEFSFNGNLHPALTDWEINYPATLTGLRGETNIPLAELEVRPDAEARQRLQLMHRGLGKVVLPVDLGFVNPLRRPPLFRVLELFSPSAFHRIYFPWSLDGSTSPPREEAPRVIYRPRVVYGKRVVLSRRSWLVPAEILRQVVAGKGPAAAFHALRRWSAAHSLPEDVFFHAPRSGLQRPVAMMQPPAAPVDDEETATEAEPGPVVAGKRRRRPSHKPQYLSFGSACLCELLVETVRDYDGYLAFEEMLPSPRMLGERRGHRHVTELIIQLDRDPS